MCFSKFLKPKFPAPPGFDSTLSTADQAALRAEADKTTKGLDQYTEIDNTYRGFRSDGRPQTRGYKVTAQQQRDRDVEDAYRALVTKKLAAPTTPTGRPVPQTPTQAEQLADEKAESVKRRNQAQAGKGATILNGGAGVLGAANVSRPTLAGRQLLLGS